MLSMWKNFVSGLSLVNNLLMVLIFILLVAGIFFSLLAGDVETLENRVANRAPELLASVCVAFVCGCHAKYVHALLFCANKCFCGPVAVRDQNAGFLLRHR